MEKYEINGNFLLHNDRCPRCKEKIVPEDVEMFPACPFCGKHFNDINRVEDFALNLKTRAWANAVYRRFLRGEK